MICLKQMNEQLLIALEIQADREELKRMGFSTEEIDGYVEFFFDNWYSLDQKEKKNEYILS